MTKSSFILERENERPILIDYMIPGEDPKGVILFAHGFKGYKDWGDWNLVQYVFAEKGFVFVKFNFSCNGGAMDNPIDFPDLEAFSQNSYWQEQIDIKNVIDWTYKKFGKKVSLIGHSRGGAAVLLQANNEKVKSIISWAGVSDLFSRLNDDDVEKWQNGETVYKLNGRTKQEMPMSPKFYSDLILNKEDLDIESVIRSTKTPVMAIHAINDLAVSFKNSENLKTYNKLVQIKILSNGGHTFGSKHPSTANSVNSDLKDVVNYSLDFLHQL